MNDGAMKQSLGRGHGRQHGRLPAAAGLAEDGDVLGIAAERRDVVAHPFERQHQIQQARVTRAV